MLGNGSSNLRGSRLTPHTSHDNTEEGADGEESSEVGGESSAELKGGDEQQV